MKRSCNRVLEAALSGLLVGLLAAGPALAQQPPLRLLPRALPSAANPRLTVLVVPLDAPAQSQVPRLTYQAEQAVAGAGRFELVRLADALDPQAAAVREAKAQEAAAASKEGQKAYDELDTQKALQQFDVAAQTYEVSDLSRHFSDMSHARVMKIASYVANGDNKAFARELKEVLARNPLAEFSPNFFPADQLAVVEKTRKGILTDANRTLQVKTGDVIAQVFVDGKFHGSSPLTLSGLTPSEHFVTAIAPGYAHAQGKFRGEASITLRPVAAEPRLRKLVAQIVDEPEGADRDAALRELGTLAGTQQVLALLVRGTPGAAESHDAIAVRLDVSDGHNLGYAAGPVPLMGQAMETAIQSLLAGVLQADTPRTAGPVKHVGSGTSGRRVAGYALLATGVALVAGGVFFGLQASSKSDEFKETPQRDPDAEDLKSDGKTFALMADVGIVAGLIAGGTGTWLAFSGGGGEKAKGRPTRSEPPAPPPAPSPETTPTPPPAEKPAEKPVPAPTPQARPAEKPAEKPTTAPTPQPKPSASTRAEEERRAREEAAKREEEERLKREEEEKRKREEEEKRKREEEERRKREEEEKKKRPPLDEDDLRNY